VKTVEIIEKDYLPEQTMLINIFRQRISGGNAEFPVIFKIPNEPNKIKTHIDRIPCKTVGKQDGYMIIAMEVVDFISLMVKNGIEVRIYDKEVITGAETASPKGKFVSAFGGDMNQIQELAIQPGKLTFGWVHTERPREGEPERTRHLVYKARLAGDKLEGTFEVEGQNRPPLKWTGVRAPVIRDKDDGTWREGKPVTLFNGKDLTGWRAAGSGPPAGWAVVNGNLTSTGHATNLISDAKFWNFTLHVEYRVGAHSNSGVGLRGRYEIQVLEDYGRPPNTHGNGALYSRVAPGENAGKPAGEWQTYDIRLVGRQVTVVLNGKKVIDRAEAEGLTAIAIDPNEAESGPIYLQGDHGAVEFRNIVVTPLIKN
jgi:hypothetical protein